MPDNPKLEPMLEMYVYETIQLIDRLEQLIMDSEVSGDLSEGMEEIFRIMHTIKGNSMMMMFEGIAGLSHITEDLFDYLRKAENVEPDYERITDLVLDGIDHIKISVQQLEAGGEPLGKPESLIQEIKEYLDSLTFMNSDQAKTIQKEKDQIEQKSQKYYIAPDKGDEKTTHKEPDEDRGYEVVFRFSAGSEMENIRAFSVVHGFKEKATDILHIPSEIVEDEGAMEYIQINGFQILFRSTEKEETIHEYFNSVAFAENMKVKKLSFDEYNEAIARYLGTDVEAFDTVEEIGESVIDSTTEVQGFIESTTEEQPFIDSTTGEQPIVETADPETELTATSIESDVVESVTQEETEIVLNDMPEIVPEINDELIALEEKAKKDKAQREQTKAAADKSSGAQNYISVGIPKVDKLMDLVGELVVSESMVTRNPDLTDVQLENFDKAVRQHRIIINELQDIVMSIRMMPLSMTFQKMNRLVRDMKKKVGKDIDFELRGKETEVDKNVIEQIGDPLMHIIRNSIDHGIESNDVRELSGKKSRGKIILEAKHSGGDVWITVKDNGKGINTEHILNKAESKGLLMKQKEEYTDREVYNFLFHSGFSTKEQVTEFSGRGVGLDVVARNVEALGGTIIIDSELGKGSEFAIRIPLTLAIIDGMMMSVNKSIFVLPITAIKESFSAKEHDVIVDPEGHEMCMIRGECYPILRLHDRFGIKTECKTINDGILIMTEYDGNVALLFADAILGEQQVVVKNLSSFLQKVEGISGCALLGDGRISLILDPAGLVNM